MKRLLVVAAALAVLAAGAWFLAGPPRAYLLRKECARYQEERRQRLNLLRFQRARADLAAAIEVDRKIDQLLRETRTFSIRGWEVVLVPAGALAPGHGHSLALRLDPSVPADPPQLKGGMDAWTRPPAWLARVLGG